jgi:lipoprotein-anchoring transpeptidase ErfK/SrfK
MAKHRRRRARIKPLVRRVLPLSPIYSVGVEPRGEHLGGRVWWARWWAIAGAVALVAGGSVAALAASGGSSHKGGTGPAAGKPKAQPPSTAAIALAKAQLAAAIAVSPATGTSGVPLNTTIIVTTPTGYLTSVQVTDAAGSAVTGTLAPSGLEWRTNVPLQPAANYHVAVTVARPDGITAQRTTTFSTLTPTYQIGATAFPSDGMTVGVGQPLVVTFDHYVRTATGQANALRHLTVSMSKPVPGGWHWFSMDELHFRPKAYWPTGEKVTVKANFDGWDAGLGRWGKGQIDQTFSIGDARISTVNLSSDTMQVTRNGAVVANYPISGGRQQYPTMNGDHLVMDKSHVVHMVSSTVGIPVNSPGGYDELVYNDVHISDSGEYVHAAPWSVGAQGVLNVSHGCINMSTANSLAFFDFSQVGDVIKVIGGPRPPVAGDHGVMDWSTDWSQWTPASVHKLA